MCLNELGEERMKRMLVCVLVLPMGGVLGAVVVEPLPVANDVCIMATLDRGGNRYGWA